jgi:hypothetical protein
MRPAALIFLCGVLLMLSSCQNPSRIQAELSSEAAQVCRGRLARLLR